jgi:hypothetical protein
MAKIRHRTFEMFDFLQEATSALASKSPRVTTDASDPESWKFRQLIAVIKPSGVVHVTFKQDALSEADSVNDFGTDLTQLTGLLVNGSRVLLDFEGVLEFGADSIIKLTEFNGKLLAKGSRVVLCNLDPNVRASFFPHESKNART